MDLDRLEKGISRVGKPATPYELLDMVDGKRNVAQLGDIANLKRSSLQYKLKQLREGGFIEQVRQGRNTLYRRTDQGESALKDSAGSLVDLPSPRQGWKRKDRRLLTFRNDDGSLSYGRPKTSKEQSTK
jgi:DNA-binding transcriptional ArsR family regulator